jgi:hypothetical protein
MENSASLRIQRKNRFVVLRFFFFRIKSRKNDFSSGEVLEGGQNNISTGGFHFTCIFYENETSQNHRNVRAERWIEVPKSRWVNQIGNQIVFEVNFHYSNRSVPNSSGC